MKALLCAALFLSVTGPAFVQDSHSRSATKPVTVEIKMPRVKPLIFKAKAAAP